MNQATEGALVERELGNMEVDASTVALLNASEINQQIATAKRYPRSIQTFRNEALAMVTLNEQIAEECLYSLPRDGKVIEGPSARLAEVLASAWGNCRAGARVVDEAGEFVTAQGAFHDLQRNVAITYEVKRRIVDKYGKRYKPDMVGVTANAACSIALRNAILKGIPKAFWSDVYDAARKTVMGDFKTLENRRADALKAFQAFGVTDAQIFALLEVKGIEDVTLEHLLTLRGLLTALRENETTVEQAFPSAKNGDAPQTGNAGAKEALKQRQAKAPETPPAQVGEKTAIDFIAKLDELTTEAEISAYSENEVPEAIRSEERYTQAVKKRLDAIKGKPKK